MRRCSVIAAVLALWLSPASAQTESPAPAIVADAYMTPAAGAIDLLSVQRALASIEDRLLPLKFGGERTRTALVAGILYRATKFTALDVPQDHMLLVVGHEVFGHGARLRELGAGRTSYGFDVPIPYGHGGGVTRFEGDVPDSPLAILTIESSGIEAQHVLAETIAERALARGRFHYREAWMYFESRHIAMTYIADATEFSREGNDVADFVRTFEESCTRPDCTPITLKDLRRGARLMLADPLWYFAVYGFASSYVGLGRATSPIPMIPLGRGVRYLPGMGFEMTPYGSEWSLQNRFVSAGRGKGQGTRVTGVTLRVANTGATRPWGIEVRSSEVKVPFTRWRVGPALNVWRQPLILADRTWAPLETGAAATATLVLPIPRRLRSYWLSGISVTAGAKSEGFVPGEQLSGGLVFRAGIAGGL